MVLNWKKIHAFDFKFSGVIFFLTFILLFILFWLLLFSQESKVLLFLFNLFSVIALVIFFATLGYNFIRGIFGVILLSKALVKKEIVLKLKRIVTFSNALYILLVFVTLYVYSFGLPYFYENRDPRQIILAFNLARINIIVNALGIPMWFIYLYSKNELDEEEVRLIDWMTKIMLVIFNWLLAFVLTFD